MSDLETYLEDVRDLACAPLLRILCEQIQRLEPEPQSEIGTFGVRFRSEDRVLCELSVFGSLFIARVGPDQSVDYRVRDVATAAAALDHIVRIHIALSAARAALA